MARCQEVISSPSAVCKQTLLMRAVKSWSYFGDQFCTPRKRNLITCLISRALRQACTNGRKQTPPTPDRGGSSLGIYCVVFPLFYNRSSVSTSSYLRINKIFKFSFLKSIKKKKKVNQEGSKHHGKAAGDKYNSYTNFH